jgi:hypothetical protein
MNHPVSSPEDWEIVQQTEQYESQVVPVDIKGIVATYILPAKYSAMRGIVCDTLANVPDPQEIIPADRRIKRVQIWAAFADVMVGTREQIMKTGTPDGFLLPQNVPMVWEGFDKPIYGITTSPGVVTVWVRYEYWAD